MKITLLNGVTATTTGDGVNISNLQNVTVQLIREDHSAGSSEFFIEGSNNGEDWDALPVIRTVANSNSQQLTRDVSVTLSSDTNELVALDPSFVPEIIRARVTETTDGTHTAILHGHKIVS